MSGCGQNWHGLLVHGTLKSTISQEWIVKFSWFFTCWYKSLKVISWVGVVKNGCALLGHGTRESAVSEKWIDELSWFFDADGDVIILLCIFKF